MAHMIEEHDSMLSVGNKPWHGLGTVIPESVSAFEAQRLAALTWETYKTPLTFTAPDGGQRPVPGSFAIVRDDLDLPLGVVGECYQPYQNSEMFGFMDRFCQIAGTFIETCGSLRNGRNVWALARAGGAEYVKGDPIDKYFLFKNSFDGSSGIEICYTDVRVVCNNTLTAALGRAKNRHVVYHTRNVSALVSEVEEALAAQRAHDEAMGRAMGLLAGKALAQEDIARLTARLVSDAPEKGVLEFDLEAAALKKRAAILILELAESGKGTDIPGVRGTAYGWLNAVTEYADHYRAFKAGDRDPNESRFESVLMGGASRLKQQALELALAA
jgi:phage/plasmid-like protein (TIGR03299 family)